MNINCQQCGKETKRNKPTTRFCSLSCASKWNYVNKHTSLFVKGHKVRVGMKHPPSFIEGRKLTGNPAWKGDRASVSSKHDWARNNFKKTGVCEMCGQEKKTDWSNKKHDYQRDRDGWQELCRGCHQKYDYGNGLRTHWRNKTVNN